MIFKLIDGVEIVHLIKVSVTGSEFMIELILSTVNYAVPFTAVNIVTTIY